MKSLKSVLVVAFACAMLFAFTACEQQPIDVLGYNPTAVEVTQNGTIITGQPLTADMFTATVTYANGQTGTVGVQIDEEAGTVTATVNNDIENTLTVKYTDPQSATVEAEFASQAVRPNETQSTTLTGTISAITLMANEASYVLPQAEFTDYTATVTLTAEQRSTAGVYDDLAITLTASGSGSIATESVGTVEVIDSTPAPIVVTGVHVLYDVTRNGEAIIEDATSLSGLYLDDEVTVTVYQTATQNGEDASTVLSTENAFENANTDVTYSSGVATITVGKTAVSDTIYYYNDEIGETRTATVSIPVGSNTVVKEGESLVLTQNTSTALAAGRTLAGNANLASYVNFTEGNGLKNLDSELDTVTYSIYVDPARTYTIPEEGTVSVNCFVSYSNYGKTVREFLTVPLSAQAGQQN